MIKLTDYRRFGGIDISKNKIALDTTLETPIYISLFGGNVEALTYTKRLPKGAENKDFWGNLFQQKENATLYNSRLEKSLQTRPLISGNLKYFRNDIKADLNWLIEKNIVKDFVINFELGKDVLKIKITAIRPNNTEENYNYLWEN